MTVTDDQQRGHPLGVPSSPEPGEARQAINEMLDAGLLDEVMDRVDRDGLSLTGVGGFLPEMIRAVLERGLGAELSGHLGYEKGDPAGRGSPNSRNGSTPKTLATEVGDVALDTPRDRAGTFEPRLVPKGARRAGGLDDMIISLYAGGMTVRDIQHHLARTLGTELSRETISNITDVVLEEVKDWQSRPLEEIYPIIYLDALVVKVRDGHQVRNRSAHIAVGVDLDGVKHVLGIWVQATEGAKFWAGVCAELRNRGVRDVLIVCRDGLTGFPEAIEATWPQTTVQTCTVHLIRAATGVRVLPGPQEGGRGVAPDLHRAHRRRRRDRAAGLRRVRPRQEVSGGGRDLGERLGSVHPVPGIPPRTQEDHLHDQQHRVPELPAPEDHQESGALPQRRRGDQAAVAGDPRHRGQTRPTASQGEGPAREQPQGAGPARRRRGRAQLENRPRCPRSGLPRPAGPLPHLSTPRPSSARADPFPPRRRCQRGAPAAQRGRTTLTPTSGGRPSVAAEGAPRRPAEGGPP